MYWDDATDTEVAHFAYDAMGRVISARTRYDTNINAQAQTLKYHYDGAEVIAETDESDVMQRRYIHGTRQIDERAILLSGDPDTPATLDTYYYLVRELGTVAGLIKRNGTLAEANTYDAYGKVKQWGYRDFDFNRDGDVDSGDETVFGDAYSGSGVPTANPTADFDMDGDVDGTSSGGDMGALTLALTAPNEPPVTLFTSALGNPYHFTGRRLYMLEDQPCTGGLCPGPRYNVQLQRNRARFYKPDDGRWLNRDPAGYVDGMNLYEYLRSGVFSASDPWGLQAKTHKGMKNRVSGRGKFSGYLIGVTGKNRSELHLTFHPASSFYKLTSDGKRGESCSCTELAFIQIKWRENRPSKGIKYTGSYWMFDPASKDEKVPDKENSFFSNGPAPRWPLYPGQRTIKLPDSVEFGPDGALPQNIRLEMDDLPGHDSNDDYPGRQEYEACVFCNGGEEVGNSYGCVRWGHKLDAKDDWQRWLVVKFAPQWGSEALQDEGGPDFNKRIGGTDFRSDAGYYFEKDVGRPASDSINTLLADTVFPIP